MEIYVARQPIFDRHMNTYGYELLYRKSLNNTYDGDDDNQSTAALINNVYLAFGSDVMTEGKKAFINFPTELIEREIPTLLPKDHVVIEILEHVEPSASVIRACAHLKNKGYLIALDDFVFHEKNFPLFEIADIIKIEFTKIDVGEQRNVISSYKEKYNKRFLAEKVETREQYDQAMELGYDLFQGYFFSKPVIVQGREIKWINTSVLQVIHEVNKEEPDFQKITEIIEKDVGLTYKLLKAANSVFYGSIHRIRSVKQALIRFGLSEIRKWMYLLMLKDAKSADNDELLKISLIRGKFMELLSAEMKTTQIQYECFLTGILSSVDVILKKEMRDILNDLPLTHEIKDALMYRNNELGLLLDFVICFETANWQSIEEHKMFRKMDQRKLTPLYLEACRWAQSTK